MHAVLCYFIEEQRKIALRNSLTIFHTLSETAHAEYSNKWPNGEEQNKAPDPATPLAVAEPGNPDCNENFSNSKGKDDGKGDVVGELVVAEDYSTSRLVEHHAHIHNQSEQTHYSQHTYDQLQCTLMSLVYVVLQVAVAAALCNGSNHTYHQHLSHAIQENEIASSRTDTK